MLRKLGVVLFMFRHANRISRVWPLYRKTPRMKNNTSYTTESNDNSTSSSQNRISSAEGIVLCSILLLEAIGIVAGNLLTIFQFTLNKKLRKKSFFLVINMAIADVLLGAVSLPLLVILLVGPAYQLWQIEVNTSLLIFFNLLDAIFALASLISAVLISCERFFAIYKPLKHRTLSRKAYRIVLFTAWTLAICLAVVLTPLWYLVSSKHAFATWMAFPLVFLFVVCGCNIGIYRQYQHRINCCFSTAKQGTSKPAFDKNLAFCVRNSCTIMAPINNRKLFNLCAQSLHNSKLTVSANN